MLNNGQVFAVRSESWGHPELHTLAQCLLVVRFCFIELLVSMSDKTKGL